MLVPITMVNDTSILSKFALFTASRCCTDQLTFFTMEEGRLTPLEQEPPQR